MKSIPSVVVIIILVYMSSVPVIATTQYMISSPNQVYYPATKLDLQFINLVPGSTYELLIGANQNSYDWQWNNFTALSQSMTISIIHFDHQSMLDNKSAQIKNLLLVFYDSNSIQIDHLWLKIQSYATDFNIVGLAGLLFGSSALFVAILIAYSITKYIIVKLL